jgi:hypothetical protein
VEEHVAEQALDPVDVYVELGQKLTFAGALDWPGWTRSGRGEAAALQALWANGPRYAGALGAAGVEFRAPAEVSELVVSERLHGNATTDFGAPGLAPSADARPVDALELRRLQNILAACWQAFDRTVEGAGAKELSKGPRGGGRELAAIVRHVLTAHAAYLGRIGWKYKPTDNDETGVELRRIGDVTLEALAAAAAGSLPATGPRGAAHWTPRYFARRAAWHILDHAWEIEDRAADSAG